jgi:glycosyltransferase involved in cell wall biosynthesis
MERDAIEDAINSPAIVQRPGAKVSVGLPVYNGERYLDVTIKSVLTQTWANLELVICDNGSTDRTEAICRDFAAQDSRVKYHRNPRNIGAAGNFCRTFELSNGTFFRWLCADDFIGPASIERCVALLEANPDAALACTRTEFVDETGATRPYAAVQALPQPRAFDRFRAVFNQDPWCNAAYGLYRRATLAKTALQQPFPASDKALLIELSMHGRFLEVDEPLFFRRVHPGAYSFAISTERDREFYTPESGRKSPMARAWPNIIAYLKALMRAPVPFGERLRMTGYVLRLMLWQRKELLSEIGDWMRRAIRE